MMIKATVVVTRHTAFRRYLIEERVCGVTDQTPVIEHVTDPAQLRGQIVLGILPLHLAAEADAVIEIPLRVPLLTRGKELTIEEIRQYAEPPRVFEVQRVW